MKSLQRTIRSTAAAVMTTLLVAGCGGDGGTTDPITNDVTSLTISIPSLTIARGDAESAIISIARRVGYTGNITFSAEGAPNGVTVTFSPATLAGSATQSEMTVTVASTAAAGTYAVTIRAKGSGSDSKTAPLTVIVSIPSITVSSGATSATVAQGQSTTVGVSVARAGGFEGTVALEATGLPAGVTATFDPTSLTGSQTASTLTLATSETTPVGEHTVTIRGTGTGVDPKTTTVTLNVTAANTPGVTLSSNPALVPIVAGGNGQTTINIGRSGGFAGNVTFEVQGTLPTGVTVGFAPNNTATNSTTMTINTTAAAPRGPLNITVRGTGTGITAATTTVTAQINDSPGINLSLTAATQSVAQSANAANTLTLSRLGGFGGAVTLDVEGLPANVTTTLPASIAAGSGTQNTPFVVNVGQTALPGTYPITITGTGAGGIEDEVTYTLTVTAGAGYTLTATPAALTIQQGQSQNSAIALNRAGGFASAVTLSLQGFPAGITGVFTPAAPTGNTSALVVSVAGSVDAGTYNGTIRGVATGLGNVEIPLSVTVTATGGGNAVAWQFCDAAGVPLWFAYQDGNGAWQRVTMGANNTFNFNLTQATGGVTYVQNAGAGFDVQTFYGTRQELQTIASEECAANPGTKSVTGTVSGVEAGQQAMIVAGFTFGFAVGGVSNSFQLNGMPDGPVDIIGFRFSFDEETEEIQPLNAILRRNQNPAANSALPVFNFGAGSAEAFTLANAQYTFTNTLSEELTAIPLFFTGNGSGSFLGALLDDEGSTTVRTIYGIPSARTQAGDFHLVGATAEAPGGLAERTVVQVNRELANRTVAFGAALNSPTVTTVAAAPYLRLRTAGNWQADYNAFGTSSYAQTTRSWDVSFSRGYTGAGAAYQVDIPDLSAVTGWQNTWGLQPGNSVDWELTMHSLVPSMLFTEGLTWRSAARLGTVSGN